MGRVAPLLPPLGVAGLVTLAWLPLLADGLRGEDFHGHAALLHVLAELRAADGPLPLWNALEYAGTSLVPAYLHPIGSLAFLTPFAAWLGADRGLAAGAVVFLALAALAMYGWCRAWGGSRPAAALGALVYGLHPSVFGFVGEAGHLHQPVTLAVVPLVFLAWTRLAESPGVGRALAAAVVSAALLLDMQRFFLVMPFVVLAFATVLATRPLGPQRARSLGGAAAWAAGVGIGTLLLLAFPLLPLLEERAWVGWHGPDVIAAWREKLSFTHALELVDRDGWLRGWLAPLPAGRSVGTPGQWYQGIAALGIVLSGAVLAWRRGLEPERRLRLAVVLASWALVVTLAFGPHRLLVRHLELGREAWRAGADGALVLLLCGGLLALWTAAFLWARAAVLARWPARRGLVEAGMAGLVLFAAMASPFAVLAGLVPAYDQMRAPAHFAFPLLPFLTGSAVALVVPVWERVLRSAPRAAAAAALAALLVAVDVAPYRERAAPAYPESAEATLRESFGRLAAGPPGRVLDVSGYAPLADRLALEEARRPNAWGWLAWTSTRHTAELLRGGFAQSFLQRDFELAAALAGLANVRFLSALAYRGVRLPETGTWPARVSNALVTLAENRRGLPYTQLYSELAWLSGPLSDTLPLLARLTQQGVAVYTFDAAAADPRPDVPPDYALGLAARSAAPRAGRPPARGWPPQPAVSAAPCTRSRPRPTRILLRCELAAPGYLVIAESWSPRWQARVDRAPRPLWRLNHAFQGLAVEAGSHDVELVYVPSALARAGLALSGITVLASGAYGLVALGRARRGRRRPDPPGDAV